MKNRKHEKANGMSYIITFMVPFSGRKHYVENVSRTNVYYTDDPSKAMRYDSKTTAGRKAKKAARIFQTRTMDVIPDIEVEAVA